MAVLKSERHHWWPETVSQHWADESGTIGRKDPAGNVVRLRPKQLGVIKNAHHIKLANKPGESTDWDTSFEDEFDEADNRFNAVIEWLQGLERKDLLPSPIRNRFVPQPASDKELIDLTTSVVSLAVRSPRNREASVQFAESRRGPLPEGERNVIIGANMMRSQRIIADAIGTNAKFAILYSKDREFIYGDGFFHNVTAVVNRPHMPKLLAPITPNISVIITRPVEIMVDPRLVTLVLSDEEVDSCNWAVQVHSRDALFFRSQEPTLDASFICGKHLVYRNSENPIDHLMKSIPGVRSPDDNWM